MAKEKEIKGAKKTGDSKWYKGMPAPEGAGRPKGLKDSPFAPRQKKKHDALFWRQMEEEAIDDGYPNLAAWMFRKAKDNPEFESLLMERILSKLGTDAVGETQERLALSGMLRDVITAESTASGESGGQTINIITGGGIMSPSEDMRQVDAIDVQATPMLEADDDSSGQDDDDNDIIVLDDD